MIADPEYIQALKTDFPDTDIFSPGCGAKCVYFVCTLFEEKAPTLDEIALSLQQSRDSVEVSFAEVRDYLIGQGLYCYPLKATFADLSSGFDTFVSVVHTRRSAEISNINESTGHFSILVKQNDEFRLIEPTEGIVARQPVDGHLGVFESELGYTGTALLVSSEPLKSWRLDRSGPSHGLEWAGVCALLSIGLVLFLRSLRRGLSVGGPRA